MHELQPEGDVERGWHGKLGKLWALGNAALRATGLARLPPPALALL